MFYIFSKVGTLDQLVGLSDDLARLDTFVEGVMRKTANYLGEVLEDQRDKLHENLKANQGNVLLFVLKIYFLAIITPKVNIQVIDQ